MIINFDYFDIWYDDEDKFTVSFKVKNAEERESLIKAIDGDEIIDVTVEV